MRDKPGPPKHENGGSEMEMSGAYIRSIVKQLASSRTRISPNSKDQDLGKNNCNVCAGENMNQTAQHHKKQVRRRLHTSRPYQERLLNMAEARKEIVAALKFHRESMKQTSDKQQKLDSGPGIPTSSVQVSPELDSGSIDPRFYASNALIPNNFLGNFYCSASYPYSSITPPPLPVQDTLNLPVQSKKLGLNLNLQDFNEIEAVPLYYTGDNPPPIYTSSSPSSSSFPPADELLCMRVPPSAVVNDVETAEIRSVGEQHQAVWSDTMNLITSDSMEMGTEAKKGEDFGTSSFEVMEFPTWLSANEGCFQHLNHDYLQEPALPCMDIEEIEGMDVDWLA